MSGNNLKTHYSAKELAELSLACLPKTKQGVLYQAKKQGWKAQKKVGVGGEILEFPLLSLPETVQTEIRKKFAVVLVEQKPKLDLAEVRQSLDLRAVTDKQIAIADARMGIAQHFLALQAATGMSRNQLKQLLCDEIKAGSAPQQILDWVAVANAKGKGKQTVSPRTLYEWVLEYEKSQTVSERMKSLVPLKNKERVLPETEKHWLLPFLERYQTFSKPSVQFVYRQMEAQGFQLPTLSKVRRVLAKIPKIVLERGRSTGADYKAILPFKRKKWYELGVNVAWVSDGHSFKARVKNVDGVPYVPEVTVFLDARTRFIVGWSVAQSESVIAVSDAFRHAVAQHGLPVICYSDNGRGQANKTLDAEITGLLPRLGVTHATGIPGNPQGRGIIERLWQQTLIDLARTYQTYHGDDADTSTKHLTYRKLESAINALTNKKQLNDEQKRYMAIVPTFEQFIADLTACVVAYNQRPHSALPKKPMGGYYSPEEFRAELMRLENFVPNTLDSFEMEMLFRPEVVRTVARGEVRFDNKFYFSNALANHHEEKVRVSYDIHDPSNVIVKRMNGEWICAAQLGGNAVDAVSKSVLETAKERSIQAKNKRLADRIKRNNAELNPVITIEHSQPELITTGYRPMKEKVPAKPFFNTFVEKEEWELEQQRKQAVG